jgi:branched-chain amino acid aminotransferase
MTITADILWLDGEMTSTAKAGPPLMSHALQRGSLVFDVGSFSETARGPALFRVRDHAARFLRSAKIVGLEVRYDEDALVSAARRAVSASGLRRGLVRWSAFFAAREPDLVPRDRRTSVAVAAQATEDGPAVKPIRVAVFDDARKAARDVLPPEAKAAAAYLGPMIAKGRAIAAGADEVVLLDDRGDIAEGPTLNAFAVVSGTLWTPPLGRILPGITRDTILTLSRAEGIPIREERLPRDVFASAEEAFLSSTSGPVAPIAAINQRTLEAPGPITTRVIELCMAARRNAEAWLTYL